jgi:hypothetical protein
MELLSILRRRWILAGVLFLLTLVGTAFAFTKVPWTYQSTSSVVFLAPKDTAKSFGGNPYLAFNSALNQTADVVRYETNDARTVNLLAAQGDTQSYLVTDAVDTAGPVLMATVTGKDKADVERTLRGVTIRISTELAGLQTYLSPNNKIRDLVITFTPTPTRLTSKKAKPLLVVLGLGIVLTIGIPVVVDAQRAGRRKDNSAPAEDYYGRSSGQPGYEPGAADRIPQGPRQPERAFREPDRVPRGPREPESRPRDARDVTSVPRDPGYPPGRPLYREEPGQPGQQSREVRNGSGSRGPAHSARRDGMT